MVSIKLLEPLAALLMVKALDQYGWMTWHALEMSRSCTTAVAVDGVNITVPTVKTPVSSVLQFAWQMVMVAMVVWRFA